MDELAGRVALMLSLDEPPEEALILELLRQGEALALSYMGRASLPPGLESCLARLAVALYNRLGQEGETSRKEGEITVRMELMPEDIKVMLRPHRVAKAVAQCG
ncbi:MAG: phage head-tail connector protein [Eubacteriales bacterium]|nr:phage head-tail connector protein [Eubacteriales bacterium]